MNKILFTMLCCSVFFAGCGQKEIEQQTPADQQEQSQSNAAAVFPQDEIPLEMLPVELQEKIKREVELENQRDPKIYPSEKETNDAQLMRITKIKNRVLAEEAAKSN